MIAIRGAADRFRTASDGIESLHCFAAGPHYDPDNIAFGPVVGVDEHRLAPGAAFPRHAHSGVVILSWVLDGALRHEDSAGHVEVVRPGRLLVQDARARIEHVEGNASDAEPLRFVQTTWLASGGEPVFAVYHRCDRELLPAARLAHLYVARGAFTVSGHELGEGDSLRAGNQVLRATGSGELLVVSVES